MSDISNTLSQLIQKTETKWLNVLYRTVQKAFENVWIPSHDNTHHLRVWNYAKQLVIQTKHDSNQHFIINLLFACFFHDAGMSITTNKEHGKHSRELCEKFIAQHQIDYNLHDALEAIEHHDDKAYKSSHVKDNEILKYLSVADDLDAYDAMGVYRYFEIYHLRGIDMHEMPAMVIENAKQRFANFKKQFATSPEVWQPHKNRLEYLCNFYNKLAKQANQSSNLSKEYQGPAGVLNNLQQTVLEQKLPINTINVTDSFGKHFLELILDEVE